MKSYTIIDTFIRGTFLKSCAVVFALLLVGIAPAQATLSNIAAGREVSLVSGSIGAGNLYSVTDEIFRPRGTQWQDGTVWWNGLSTILEIDLGGTYALVGAIVQADDNDAYLLQYYDPDGQTWHTLWDVPNYDNYGWGMQTRPNPDDDGQWLQFAFPVRTNKVRFSAAGGDNAYSVSEIQLAVPEPATLLLLGLGAPILSAVRKIR